MFYSATRRVYLLKMKKELCGPPGLFNVKQRYPTFQSRCGPNRRQYMDVKKGKANEKSYCASAKWRCRLYPRVCCNQVVGFRFVAGPHPKGALKVGVCNGQFATKYRGARHTIPCSDPCGKGKVRDSKKCPCCPKRWYRLTGGPIAPDCGCYPFTGQ